MMYIIRHGQTEMNQLRRLQGRSDHPLNEAGIAQAGQAARGLQTVTFDHVFTSPLKRAIQTAEIIAPGVSPVTDDRLIELTFFSDFVHNPAPGDMEQLSSVVSRAGAFLEDIKNLKGNILISTHAIAMKGILEYLTPGSNGAYWSKYIGNCAVYAAENADGKIGIPKEIPFAE